jgi:hypothetical protein
VAAAIQQHCHLVCLVIAAAGKQTSSFCINLVGAVIPLIDKFPSSPLQQLFYACWQKRLVATMVLKQLWSCLDCESANLQTIDFL